MAVKYPTANGNWSTAANWNDGTLPATGDIVCANGKTVTIDMDLAAYTFDRLTTVATSPAAAGGGFTMGISGTINANITAGTTTCLTSTGTGTTLFINGEIKGGSSNARGLTCSGDCTVTITGNVTGWSGSSSWGVYCTAACTMTITGNVTGGSGNSAYGIYCNAANQIITISGTILGETAMGVFLTSATTGSSLTVTGVIGDGTGETAVKIDSASTLNVIATVVASVSGHGIYAPLSTLTYRGILTNYASRMAVVVAHMILTANTDTIWTFYDTASNYVVMASNATDISQPAQKDVRLNTVYGLASQFIGSLAVPPPAAVLLGVPTDNVVGTLAPASASDVWDHLLTGISVAGSIGKLIKDNLDVPVSSITGITPAQIWDYLLTAIITPGSIGQLLKDDIDAKISTRATPTDITTSLTAFGVSTLTVAQVWDYLTAAILTPGSIGKLLVNNIDTKLSDLPTLFWSKVIDGTYTADKVLKIMASILAGKTVIVDTGNNTAIVTFRNLDNTGDVVKANMNNSERITMTLTP